MHNSYFVLRALGRRLSQLLAGCMLHSCYSQDKDELVIIFVKNRQQHFLHAIARPEFSMIRVPHDLKRARKNSVSLFPELNGAKVLEVYCIENERCLCISFDRDRSLLFKLFGHQSNVLLTDKGIVSRIFKQNLKADLSLSLNELKKEVTISKTKLKECNWDFARMWPPLGGRVRKHIEALGYHQMDDEAKWALIQEVLDQLQTPYYFLYNQNEIPVLTLFEPLNWTLRTKDVVEALNGFYTNFVRAHTLKRLKREVLVILERKKKRAKGVVVKSRQRLAQLEQSKSYREMADIIMANLHTIPNRASSIQLPDFKTGELVTIKLKPLLSAQKNAEQYYRKSKNQNKELKVLKNNLETNRQKVEDLERHIVFIRNCQQPKDLKRYASEHEILSGQSAEVDGPKFKEYRFLGYLILVGRNAANNDLLTLKYTHKDDLWLHAKDVKGSHVVIKQIPGKPFPGPVIEKAAELAAFYSKRKQDSLCPVIYTPKKYVRKRKGTAAGQVVVERENVLLVKPYSGSFHDGNLQ